MAAFGEEAKQAEARWRGSAEARGWICRLPAVKADALMSDRTDKILQEALESAAADPERTYLIGEGLGASAVFYWAARRPDWWAAAVAIGGSPRPAIETNRLFAANTQLLPVLWVRRAQDPVAAALASRLREFGYKLVDPPKSELMPGEVLDWLTAQRRDRFPLKVDCETGHPDFARCYWAEITELDFTRRNDVLPSSRVPPGSGASLALGPFGFDVAEPGPGVLVSRLPDNYRGPLRLGDRIVAVGGKQLADARAYLEFMEQQTETRNVGVVIVREGRRTRVESRILLPKREEALTARIRAEYLPQSGEILLVTRGAAALRLHIPQPWTPARLNWNGAEAGVVDREGCWQVSEGGFARPCTP